MKVVQAWFSAWKDLQKVFLTVGGVIKHVLTYFSVEMVRGGSFDRGGKNMELV